MPESPGAFHAELRFIPVRSAFPGIPPTIAINPGPEKYLELILSFLLLQDRPGNRVQNHEPLQSVLGVLLGQYKQVIALLSAPSERT
jgi:hypothetical protein